MIRKLAPQPAPAKSARFRDRNQKSSGAGDITPVMQKVRGSLARPKPENELEILTGIPIQTGKKLLAGFAFESGNHLRAMAQTRLAVDVVIGLTEHATDPIAQRMWEAAMLLKHEIAIEDLRSRRRS